MTSKIYDSENHRTIECDYEHESLTIVGDYSSSSLTSYWVVNRFNLDKPYGVFITKNGALRRCSHLNLENKTDSFIVVQSSIFI